MPVIQHPRNYSLEEVCMWLVAIGMDDKIPGFKENGIDGGLLVTLTNADLTGDLGFTNLQARKLLQGLEFTVNLAEGAAGGGGGGDVSALKAENEQLKAENQDLKAKNKQMYEKLYGPPPAPAPAPARAPAPAPAPRQPQGPTVVGGAAKGALRGATLGAIGGAIAGDPRKGAKMGAAMGGAAGGMNGLAARRRRGF